MVKGGIDMNMQYTQSQRSRREVARGRILLILAVIIFFAGLFLQITMLSRVSAQKKTASAIEQEIVELSASADNLELSINQHHNLKQIAYRAVQMGMARPNETQIRVVSVARSNAENTSVQTAELIGGEEIQN